MVDVEALSCQLVRALRGKRSQVALCRRLNCSSNVVYLWESGRRYPSPASFFWLAHRTGVDVHAALQGFRRSAGDQDAEPWTVPGAAALLQDLRGQHSAAELARRLGRSRHSVARWLRGDTECRLPDLLRIVEAGTTRQLDFVARFVDPSTLPATAGPWRRLLAARRMVAEEPWAPAVLLSLELARYQALGTHQSGWIAGQLGLDEAAEVRCLGVLADAGYAQLHEGLWRPTRVPVVDVHRPGQGLELRRWWGQAGLDRLQNRPDHFVSWNLFTVSEDELEQIKTLQRGHHRAVRAIAKASTKPERLVLNHLQLVALDEGD